MAGTDAGPGCLPSIALRGWRREEVCAKRAAKATVYQFSFKSVYCSKYCVLLLGIFSAYIYGQK